MKCTIKVCKNRATWEGEIKSPRYAEPVYYCDGHANFQWQMIASSNSNMTIHLTPIQQRSER